MKKVILLVFFLLSSFQFYAMKQCECGTHATGITYYFVGDSHKCCGGTPSLNGYTKTYIEESLGIWVLDEETTITGQAAQGTCCNNPAT